MRIDAQDTTALITTHQIRRQSHVIVHYNPSACSILGVYPNADARRGPVVGGQPYRISSPHAAPHRADAARFITPRPPLAPLLTARSVDAAMLSRDLPRLRVVRCQRRISQVDHVLHPLRGDLREQDHVHLESARRPRLRVDDKLDEALGVVEEVDRRERLSRWRDTSSGGTI